jgi:parvulin-like peptidyl-prolyl isomerase
MEVSMKRMSVVLMLFFLIAGCAKSAITVDDVKISKEVFNIALKERLAAHKAMNIKVDEKAVRKAVADELIAQSLLVKEAKEKGVAVTNEEVQKMIDSIKGGATEQQFRDVLRKKGMPENIFRDRVKDNLFVSKLLVSLVKDDSVTEEEMKNFYEESPSSFMSPGKEFVKVLQIKNESATKRIADELKKGADFDALGERKTKSGNVVASDYGWIDPDMLPPGDVASAMKTAKLNVVSGPYKGADGAFYFFKIKKRQSARILPYEEVKMQIRNMLLGRKRQEVARNIVAAGRKNAKIVINE